MDDADDPGLRSLPDQRGPGVGTRPRGGGPRPRAALEPHVLPGGPAPRPPLGTRLGHRRLVVLDALAATGFTVLLLALTLLREPAAGTPALVAPCVIVAGMGPPAAVRRLWPLPVFCLVLAMTVLSLFVDMVHDSFAAAAFALYLVALTRPGPRWIPTRTIGVASAVVIIGSTMAGPVGWEGFPFPNLLLGSTIMGGAWTIGRAVRERRSYVERTAEELARRAVTEERLRIARELHDVVAHSMTLITVKAGIANHVAEARPQEAREALRDIEAVGRGALGEMRHMLGVLRSESGPETAPGDLHPVPGPARLTELAERAALAGVRVELDVRGVEHLPEGVGLSVYRIVQEALTNVVRHAAPARCRVVVRGEGGEARVEVTDDGPGVRVLPGHEAVPGHGLVGMRERVVMYGGTFSAGPGPGGGFAVSARLPYAPHGDDGRGRAAGRAETGGPSDGAVNGASS